MSLKAGTLYIVATPLGNPGDLSLRAREVLGAVSGILAEDTRRSGRLLAECDIKAPPFTSLHEHNEAQRLEQVMGWLEEGKDLALISDAGTPLMSDPGYLLVRECRERGLKVKPIPGPSAVLTALSASGLPPYPFAFLGFMPRKASEQKKIFAQFAEISISLVYFDRKDRVHDSLKSAFEELGPRPACLARELTKDYEEFISFNLKGYNDISRELLGEITIVIGPPEKIKSDYGEMISLLTEEMAEGGKPRLIARRVSEALFGWSSKEIYDEMQKLKE